MKKLLSIILAIAVFTMSGSALASFNDTESHWAKEAINTWSDYGIISGYAGSFSPDRQITRGEFAVVLNRLMNYQAAAANSFSDLDNNFYTDSILKLNAKGVISGYAGMVTPNGQLTREEAAVMLCRALEIEGEESLERTFTDSSDISEWAKTYINSLVNRGLLNGYNGKLNPKNTITRAEVVTILNNAVLPVLSAGNVDGLTLDKILVISASDVTISNFVANGNVIITEGALEGTITFKDTKINGYLKINNERTSFVKLENTTVAYGDVLEDDSIIAESNATIDDTNATGGRTQISVSGGGGSSSGGGGSSSGGSSTGGDSSGSGSGNESTGGDNTGSGSGNESTGGDNTGSGSGNESTGGDNTGSGTGNESTGGDNTGSGSGNESTGGDNTGSGSGNESTGGNTGSGSGNESTGGDNIGSGSGNESTGGDNTGSGSGNESTGGDNTGSGSGNESTGGDNTGSGSGNESTGGDNTGSGSTDDEKEDIDYAAVNAEMVENIQFVLDDLVQLKIDDPWDATLTGQEKALMKIVRDCMKDSLNYKNTDVINSAFIKETYDNEIDDAVDIYNEMEAAGVDGEFHSKLAVLHTETINWLLNEFGLLD